MAFSYERIAGRSAERLAALSDGIFAVAMTLLVLDLRVPPAGSFADERALARALLDLAPHLIIYLMSFITLGIFWVGQQTQINHLERSSRGLTWTHMVFLFFVTIMPFSTRLLAEHAGARTALLFYWGNLVSARRGALHKLELRDRRAAGEAGCAGARARRHLPPHSHIPGALCVGRAAFAGRHLLEHRFHRPGAVIPGLRARVAASRRDGKHAAPECCHAVGRSGLQPQDRSLAAIHSKNSGSRSMAMLAFSQ